MRELHLYLAEGFKDDLVVVRIDGREVAHRQGLTSSPLYGLADTILIEVGEPPPTVEIELPRRGLRESFTADPATPHVAISLGPGGIERHNSRTPLGGM